LASSLHANRLSTVILTVQSQNHPNQAWQEFKRIASDNCMSVKRIHLSISHPGAEIQPHQHSELSVFIRYIVHALAKAFLVVLPQLLLSFTKPR